MGLRRPGLSRGQIGNPPGNARTAIDILNLGESGSKLGFNQGEVRAGKDDRVDPIALGSVEQRLRRSSDGTDANLLAAELRFGKLDQFRRPVADDRAVRRKSARQIVYIGLANRRLGAKHTDDPALRHFRGGLDRRNGSDDRQVQRGADVLEGDRRSRVAGDDCQPRTKTLDHSAKQCRDPAGELRVTLLAVGEPGIVGGINHRRSRKQCARGRKHREAADTGIEEEDGGRRIHDGSVACLSRSRKLRRGYGLLLTAWMTREMFLALALGYLFGSVPFGLLLTGLAGKGDIRAIGSGNIGATNVLRTGSKFLAALTLVLDCLKATVAILIAQRLFGDEAAPFAAAGALLGHVYPVWLKFRGGKGVATLLGILIPLLPIAAGVYAAIWILLLLALRISSVAGMTAVVSAPITALILHSSLVPMLLGLALLVLWKHRENIARLLAGKEPRIGRAKA